MSLLVTTGMLFCQQSLPPRPQTSVRSCRADQVTAEDQKSWWHIHLTDESGKTFLIIQPNKKLDTVLNDCKKWLYAKKPKVQHEKKEK